MVLGYLIFVKSTLPTELSPRRPSRGRRHIVNTVLQDLHWLQVWIEDKHRYRGRRLHGHRLRLVVEGIFLLFILTVHLAL